MRLVSRSEGILGALAGAERDAFQTDDLIDAVQAG
jgi:hypothetical protein